MDSKNEMAVSIVIPTYNEAKNLPLLLEEIFMYLKQASIEAEVVIVDDNSPDGTGDIAEELKRTYPLQVIHRTGKLGLGSAVRAGFKVARNPIIGVMDADLSHDPAILKELIHSLNDNDIVIGSRFNEGSTVENWTIIRQIISKSGVWIACKLTKVKDPLSGYFFLKKENLEKLELQTTGYKILLEILVKMIDVKAKEVPYTFRMRKYSTSKLNFKEFIYFGKQLIEYSWYKLFH